MANRKPTAEEIEARVIAWLESGGGVEFDEAMRLADETSEAFAESTRVRQETLAEPVAF